MAGDRLEGGAARSAGARAGDPTDTSMEETSGTSVGDPVGAHGAESAGATAEERGGVRLDEAVARRTRFRQAAIVYLHVGLLYEFAVWEIWQAGAFPDTRGPIGLWLAIGAVFAIGVPLALWFWRNVWLPRVIWGLHALRLPALLGGAFFPAADATLPTSFYMFAVVVVLVNLGFLARAGWDL